jgi:ABC-2 type transport system permease protein
MSARHNRHMIPSPRALAAVWRISVSEAVAYRAELLIWILTTTMPFVMLALWTAVAREAPVGRFGQTEFVAYFFAIFVVRQLTSSWVAWELNFQVRQGTLSGKLLRPMSPLWVYAVENLGALPLRLVIALPVAVLGLALTGGHVLPSRGELWALWGASILGGWLITYFVNVTIGSLSLFVDSSIKLMELWLALFTVFSGYLVPLELFPAWLRSIADALPFRYQIGFPVEVLTSAHSVSETLTLLGRQWAYVAVSAAVGLTVWRLGLRKYAAFGG